MNVVVFLFCFHVQNVNTCPVDRLKFNQIEVYASVLSDNPMRTVSVFTRSGNRMEGGTLIIGKRSEPQGASLVVRMETRDNFIIIIMYTYIKVKGQSRG